MAQARAERLQERESHHVEDEARDCEEHCDAEDLSVAIRCQACLRARIEEDAPETGQSQRTCFRFLLKKTNPHQENQMASSKLFL